MKKQLLLLLLLSFGFAKGQVGIGTTTPNSTSALEIVSNTKGILIPRLTLAQRNTIVSPPVSLLIYQTDNSPGYYYFNGTVWTILKTDLSSVNKINDLLDGKSSTGGSAVFLGVQSGLLDDGTDNRNTGLGFQSLKTNISGIYNTAVGHNALLNNKGNYNSGFGGNALFSNTTGTLNTGVGVNSLYANITGTRNLALGVNAMRYNTSGNYNTATGNSSLFNLTVGNRNNAIGFEFMFSSTGAYRNTANGFRSLYFNLTGSFNTAIGYEAGYNSLGAYNVFLGYNSGYNEIGSNKLYIENRGANANNALIYGEFGIDNTSTGNILRTNSQFQIGNPTLSGYAFPMSDGTNGQILQTNGSGGLTWINSSLLGTDNQNLTSAILTGTTLQINIENGNSASIDLAPLQDGGAQKINDLLDGKSNPSGETTFLGKNSGLNDSGALINKNIGLGSNALKSNINGFHNVAVGAYSLFKNTNSVNTAIGSFSMYNNISGSQNTAVGKATLNDNVSGSYNTAVGYITLLKNTVSSNTAFGAYTLYNTVNGPRNSAFGDHAGFYNVSGSGNVFMGFHAGFYETGSNKLYIENLHADENNALIYGDFGTDVTSAGNILRTNSQFQIGNPNLTGYAFPTIDGVNGQVLQTDGAGGLSWVNTTLLGTDNQNLTSATLTGTTLQINIENGNSTSIDLAPLQNGGVIKINDLSDGKSDNDGTQNGSSIFLGINAGLNDDGNDRRNIGIGFNSLQANTIGVSNTATGYQTLLSNTIGQWNTAIGYQSMLGNTSGNNNTAIGYFSLYSNTAGVYNNAFGVNSLFSNTTGQQNIAVGNSALYSNTTGNENIAIGVNTLRNNSTGYYNTVSGARAMFSNTSGIYNTAIGWEALKSNNSNYNTSIGANTLKANTSGISNTALGTNSLIINTTGHWNTGLGVNSLYHNISGNLNVASGVYALFSNTQGNNNVAMGVNTLYNNTTGNANVAIGISPLYYNTSGGNNVAIGASTMFRNTNSFYNTAVGFQALSFNTIGSGNSAFGSNAALNNVSGSANTAIGNNAMYNNVSGSVNTAIGESSFTTAVNSGFSISTAIGYAAPISASQQIRLGNVNILSIGGFANWTNVSDARFKKNIKEDVKGLDFILKLRPVTYQLNLDTIDSYLKIPDSISKGKNNELLKFRKLKEKEIQTGFIAQEVEAAAKKSNFEFSGIDKPKNKNDYYGLRYAEFVVPLVKAVQEQQKEINTLKQNSKKKEKEIDLLKRELENQKKKIEKILKLIK